MPSKLPRIQAYIPQEVDDALREYCETHGVTISAAITDILVEKLDVKLDQDDAQVEMQSLKRDLKDIRLELRQLQQLVTSLIGHIPDQNAGAA